MPSDKGVPIPLGIVTDSPAKSIESFESNSSCNDSISSNDENFEPKNSPKNSTFEEESPLPPVSISKLIVSESKIDTEHSSRQLSGNLSHFTKQNSIWKISPKAK
jgi:hypothetical protein